MKSLRHAKESQANNLGKASQEVSSVTTESEVDVEFWPLSGKPYASVILAKSHVHPKYSLKMPVKLHRLLPSATVPAVLTYRGKTWEMIYHGDNVNKNLNKQWKTFATDNYLSIGDACVFEITDCSLTKVKLKVQILRGQLPEELLARVKGNNANTPIVIE